MPRKSSSIVDICNICNKVSTGIVDLLFCDICKAWFHPKCLKINKNEFIKLKEADKSLWFCPKCQIKALERIKEVLFSDFLQSMEEYFKDKFQEIRAFTLKEFRRVDKCLATLEDNIIRCEQNFTKNQSAFGQLQNNVEELNRKLEQHFERADFESRRKNLMISNVPENIPFNTYQLVNKIGDIIECSLDRSDIICCKRLKNNRSRILIRFNSINKRNLFFEAYFKHLKKTTTRNVNHLTAKMLKISESNIKLYITEHLTKFNTNIFMKCRNFKRDGRIAECFTKRGLVFIKKNRDTNPELINNIEDIQQFLSVFPLLQSSQEDQ